MFKFVAQHNAHVHVYADHIWELKHSAHVVEYIKWSEPVAAYF